MKRHDVLLLCAVVCIALGIATSCLFRASKVTSKIFYVFGVVFYLVYSVGIVCHGKPETLLQRDGKSGNPLAERK